MHKRHICALSLLAIGAAAVAGCSGGSRSAIPAAINPEPATPSNKQSTADFTVTIPPARSTSLKPNYISVNTKSLSIVETDGTQSPSPAVVANVTPGSPGCTSGSAGLVCTISAPANIGRDTFAVTAYDGTNASGSALSTGAVSATIVAGKANTTVPLVLGGVVGSLVLTLANPYPPAGVKATTQLIVDAKDASGASIVGTYDNPVLLSAAGSVTLDKSSLASSTDGSNITATYSGTGTSAEAITASGDGKSGTVSLVPASNVLLYQIGSSATNDVFGFSIHFGSDGKLYYTTLGNFTCAPTCGEPGNVGRFDPATGSFTEVPLTGNPLDVIQTADGAIWATEYTTGKLVRFSTFSSAAQTEVPLPATTPQPNGSPGPAPGPRALAMGPDGNLWFTDQHGHRVGKINPAGPYTTAAITMYDLPAGGANTPGYLAQPGGIAAGSDGNMWIADSSNGTVDVMTTSGSIAAAYVSPEQKNEPPSLTSYPRFLALSSDGKMYLTQAGDGVNYPYHGWLDTVTAAGVFSSIPVPGMSAQTDQVAAGSSGVMYFSDLGNAALDQYTSAGGMRVYPLLLQGAYGALPNGVAVAPDNSAWFSCYGGQTPLQPLCIGHMLLASEWSVFPSGTITINGAGPMSAQPIGLAESGNSGPFTGVTSNAGVAIINPVTGSDHNFTIVGAGGGTCTITITDAHGRSVAIPVNVTATSGTVQITRRRTGV